jgi:MFS family permease
LFSTGNLVLTIAFLSLGLLLIGFTYGPLGAALAELFPTAVRYTGASLTFTLAGILGASVAPYLATYLATNFGLEYVGYYLSSSALLSGIALFLLRKVMQDK